MKKIVINTCYGGFSLSEKGIEEYARFKGLTVYPEPDTRFKFLPPTYWTVPTEERIKPLKGGWMDHTDEERQAYSETFASQTIYDCDIPRDDPSLVAAVEALGKEASGRCSTLKVIEIPDGVEWEIEEYDGKEWVAEVHETWS